MEGMVIKVGQETYVMPLSTIVECLRPARSDISNLVGTRGMLQLRGDLVPIVHLGDLLDIGSRRGRSRRSASSSSPTRAMARASAWSSTSSAATSRS